MYLLIVHNIIFYGKQFFAMYKFFLQDLDMILFMVFCTINWQGFSISLTTTMISEITALDERGRFLIVINFFVSVGKIYAFYWHFISWEFQLRKLEINDVFKFNNFIDSWNFSMDSFNGESLIFNG